MADDQFQTTHTERLEFCAARLWVFHATGQMIKRHEMVPAEVVAAFKAAPANVVAHYMENAKEILGDE